jgi:hypothetical protein
MVKIVLVVAAVVIIDSLILVLGPDSDQSGASLVRDENLSAESLSSRKMTFGRASSEEIRRARLSLLAVVVVTSGGAVVVARQIRRRRTDPKFVAL